jgi:hypothetical protein
VIFRARRHAEVLTTDLPVTGRVAELGLLACGGTFGVDLDRDLFLRDVHERPPTVRVYWISNYRPSASLA